MPVREIALVARAQGLRTHLLTRDTLEALADADDLPAFARRLSRVGASIDPIGDTPDVFAIERAAGRTANRHLRTLYRWQEQTRGVLDVFAAHQDRRSLRALLRGAAQGAPPEARLDGLVPTPLLPQRAHAELARQPSPAAVVDQLMLLSHPDAPRLAPLVHTSQPDLLAVEAALLRGFAERATRLAAGTDETLREFVGTLIDIGNVQNALLLSSGPRDVDPMATFVTGGRYLAASSFRTAATAASEEIALRTLAAALTRSPLASALPVVPGHVAHLDRAFLSDALGRLARAARVEPMSSAALLRVLLLIDAQNRDLRMLAWGAVLGTPPSLRKQQLVTPR